LWSTDAEKSLRAVSNLVLGKDGIMPGQFSLFSILADILVGSKE
jgi:hypothetical protein